MPEEQASPKIHPMLSRQLRRFNLLSDEPPMDAESWQRFLTSIADAYRDNDASRYLSDRTFDVLSGEMQVLYEELDARSAHQLSHERDRLQAVFDSVGTAICIIGAQGKISELNPAAKKLFDNPDSYATDSAIDDLLEGSGAAPEDKSSMMLVWAIDHASPWRHDDMLLRVRGLAPAPVSIVYTPLAIGDPVQGGVLTIADLSERKQAQEELAWRATHDVLTGLINRPLLMEMLAAAGQRARQNSALMAAVIVDLDHFKLFNDTRGHLTGDRLLQAVADRLSAFSQDHYTVARIGGDEFVLMLEDLQSRQDTVQVTDSILQVLAKPWDLGGDEPIRTSVSLGIAYGEGSETPAELLRNANLALTQAKNDTKHKRAVFNASMLDVVSKRARDEQQLRAAIQSQAITPVFQPQFDLATDSLMGFEALARWKSPDGPVSPSDFIPLAEECGLVEEIDHCIMEQAFSFLTEASQRGAHPNLTISVNMSSVTLGNDSAATDIQQLLARPKLDPQRVIVEITETALIENPEEAARRLLVLSKSGTKLALDDFGTGYSSLTWIRNLPLDVIKIDQSFIRNIARNGPDSAIVQAVSDLGHAVGMQVVAEGIETIEQLKHVRRLGIDIGQGFLLGRPMKWDQAMELAIFWGTKGSAPLPDRSGSTTIPRQGSPTSHTDQPVEVPKR